MLLPVNDDYMVYDFDSHRYILTERFVTEKMGIDLTNYNFPNAVYALLDKVSDEVYDYIHEFGNSLTANYVIAKTQSGRDLIQSAMQAQLTDVLINGFLDNSTKDNERDKWIAKRAKNKLDNVVIPEIGTVITYCGKWNIVVCPVGW